MVRHELSDETRTGNGYRPQGAQLPLLPASVHQRMGGRAHLPQMQALVIVAQWLRAPLVCGPQEVVPGSSMARDAQSDIQPGQRFKQSGIAWEVVDFTSANGIPHVQIMKVDDPTERKLISVSTLRDGYDLAPQ